MRVVCCGLFAMGVLGSGCSKKRAPFLDGLDGVPAGHGGRTSSSADGQGGVEEDSAGAGDGTIGGGHDGGAGSANAMAGADNGDAGAAAGEYPIVDLTTFDPNEVYVFGTLAPGAGGLDVVCHWSNPNRYLVGFNDFIAEGGIQILDGNLLYQNYGSQAVHRFVPEFVSTLKPIDLKYPTDADANDPILPTPPCTDEDSIAGPFLTSPDGRMIYRCFDEKWYEDGEVVWDGDGTAYEIAALGNHGVVLLDSGLTVMDLATRQRLTPDGDIKDVPNVAVRAVDDGFHVVRRASFDSETLELWHVTSDGVAARLGTYANFPADVYPFASSRPVLSGSGELFEITENLARDTDLIVRRTITGASEVVYTEATNPRVLLHGSFLFTGP